MIKVLIGSEIVPALVKVVRAAEKIIQAAMYEWAWYQGQHAGTVQDVNRAVAIKARAGLEVDVALHNEQMGRPLHRINVKTAKHLRNNGVNVRWGWAGTPVHCKVWIIDRRVVVAGSHNVSRRASKLNYEVSVMFDDEAEVKRVLEWYDNLWGRAR